MKKKARFYDTTSYRLKAHDLAEANDFGELLNSLTDIPESNPLHPISITKAGICNLQVMVHIADFEQMDQFVPVLCEVSVNVDLQQKRGIHMSRCVQAIFDLATRKFQTLDEFTAEVAQAVRERQGSQIGTAEVKGIYFHKTKTKKTHQTSFDKLYLLSYAAASQQEIHVKTGMQVYNLTACPCTKAYTKYSVVPELQAIGLSLEQINRILEITISGTHTQRGITTLLLDKETLPISHKDLYTVFEKSVHLVNELLKRPDENDLVIQALQNPQFTEDVAREVAFNAYEQFKDVLFLHSELYVESKLLDSIHIHDVQTVIQKTFGEIKDELK